MCGNCGWTLADILSARCHYLRISMLHCFEFCDATSSLCACTYTSGGYVLCLHCQVHVVRACQPDAQIVLQVTCRLFVGGVVWLIVCFECRTIHGL